MKNFLSKIGALLILAIAVFCLSCSSNSGSKKVGFLIHDIEGRWVKDLEYIEKSAKDEGFQLIVKTAGNDEKLQQEQMNELIEEGVKVAFVVAVNQNTAAGIVRQAKKAGVKLIAYDRIIRNSDLDYLITYDYSKVGEIMTKYALERVPKGNYVLLYGDASDANALAIQKVQQEMLKPYVERGAINIIYKTNIEGWEKNYARNQMENVVNFSTLPIDVVLASNDVIAETSADVLRENNLDEGVLITGQDATIEGCRLVAQGRQTMTVYKSTIKMAQEAMAIASKIINGERVKEPQATTFNGRVDVPTFLLEPNYMDKNNLMSTVIADGVFTKEEVYGE